ncbi:unnamed protein product [Parajaminaea phylloscopi]
MSLPAPSGDADAAIRQQRQYETDLVLNKAKLASAVVSDQGHIFLLQWLAKVETALKYIADDATIAAAQSELQKCLLQLIHPSIAGSSEPVAATSSASPAQLPKLGRPARHLLARCLVLLLHRGDARSTYDVGQSLLSLAADESKSRSIERESRTAALYVVGEIFASLGQNVMSLFVDIISTTQKVARTSSQPVIVRAHALMCLQKALSVGGRSLNDAMGKELLKNLRQSLADKAGAVVRGSAECLLTLSEQNLFLNTVAEIEAVLAAVLKEIESVDYVTKRALAKLAAGLLAVTQQENSGPVPPSTKGSSNSKKKKDAKGDASDDDEDTRPASASVVGETSVLGTLLSPREMLDLLLQPLVRAASSMKLRIAVLNILAALFATLGIAWVQSNYPLILKVLIQDIPNQSRTTSTRAAVLCIRSGVRLILRQVIGERMLGEQAQISAVQELSSSYIKRYPVIMPGQPPPPTKYTLVIALDEVSSLLHQLGTAPHQVVEALYEPLLRCLTHTSHSVQVSAAWCLRTLCYIQPSQIGSCTEELMQRLSKDLQNLTSSGDRTGAELPKRAAGHGRGLAAVIGVIPSRPYNTTFDVSARVTQMAIKLLKDCGSHPLTVSAVEIQVAWTLLSALMSLGPNFVRLHLPQLLVLWRGSLPKDESQDVASDSRRTEAEWAFLLHVRESVLTCIFAFLNHNQGDLLTMDTARRIVVLLSNTLAFVDAFAACHPNLPQEQVPGEESPSLTLLDREHMLRRRLFQCFTVLSKNSAMEPLQDSLVLIALQTFAQPERYVGSSAQAVIAASAGNFTSLWAMTDSYAFGVTSLQRDDETFIGDVALTPPSYPATSRTVRGDWLNRDSIEVQIDALDRRPVLGAAEYDPLVLFARYDNARDAAPMPPPPVTGMVDAALQLYSALLPFQKRQVQIHAFETMLQFCRSAKLEKNPGRQAAIRVNSCVASLGALKTAMQGATGIGGVKATGFNNDRMTSALREILTDALLCGEPVLRAVSSAAYGRLAAVAGSHAMSSQVRFLVDQVVTNRDPDARAGCALAFGAIYKEVGGLSAGPLTKTVVNVLMSLSSDPHPTVHYAALTALRMTIDAASLSYSPYVSSTLGMLVKLSMLDTHEPEGGSPGSVNLRADLPAHQAICRVISGLTGVLGPDLQEDAGKVGELIRILVLEFAQEREDEVVIEATKAIQHFCLFAPDRLDLTAWIGQLTQHLRSRKRLRKLAAVNGFYQLVQRQALLVSKTGGDALVADLFTQLDLEPGMDGVREVLLSWLRQTAHLSPNSWVDLCQRIVNRNVGRQPARQENGSGSTQKASSALQDEEAATLDLGPETDGDVAALQGCRWRTQLFALQCLHEVFAVVRKSGRLEHFECASAQAATQKATLMSSRITDLIRMAFTASTAAHTEIRLEGLIILRDVIEHFKDAKDPDFEEALLLEQHQAPIAAALTPAFSADSTPEVLAVAVQVCAVFVGSGVVREVDRMGRILKQLVSALNSCTDPEMNSLADVGKLSPNAAAMLKIAVFTAWSELTVASVTQTYLKSVVDPHIATLAPYWMACLLEYATIKADPEGTSIGLQAVPAVTVNPTLHSEYAGLTREILLPRYVQAWPRLLEAVTVLMAAGHAAVFSVMDGISPAAATEVEAASAFRSEPSAFFFVIYGLAFEAVASNNDGVSPYNRDTSTRSHSSISVALRALKCLCDPRYAGSALLEEQVFSELCNLCQRLVATDGPAIQSSVVQLLAAVASAYKERLLDDGGDQVDLSTGQTASAAMPATSSPSMTRPSKLTRLLRIVVSVLGNYRLQAGHAADKAALLRSAFAAYGIMASLCPPSMSVDLYAVAWHLFAELLRDERIDSDVVSGALVGLRELCDRSGQVSLDDSEAATRAVHGFLSSAVNSIEELQNRSGKVATGKSRNCMLAVAVVLTHLPRTLNVSRVVAEQFCYLVEQRLGSQEPSIALTAAECTRLLLRASGQDAPWLRFCIGQLLPGVVLFTATNARNGPAGSEEDRGTQRESVVLELLKALEGLALSVNEEARPALLGIVLPTLIATLNAEGPTSGRVHASSVSHLLALATQLPTAMRNATSKLDPEDRSKMEASIRNALQQRGGGGGGASSGRGGESSIALKSFGAS